MKSKSLNILLLFTLILFLALTVVFCIALFLTENSLYLILACICANLMIAIPNVLVKCIKIDVLKELKENNNRTIQQEIIYLFLKGDYGQFLPLDEYDTEIEVYTNFANIGYIKKEYRKDPHMAVYIQLLKKHFKIAYINKSIVKKYEEFNTINDIFSSIENSCNLLTKNKFVNSTNK